VLFEQLMVTGQLAGHNKKSRHHGTHGTDFIGCRRGEGGAINWCHVWK